MKQAHLIRAKVFSYEKNNDDESAILDKFLKLFPFELKKEKIELSKSVAEGFQEKKIIIYEAVLDKSRHIQSFIKNLAENTDERQKLILMQEESRLDENLDFFLRLDKEEYLKNDRLILTDSGNCFHIKISIAAFPKKREIALKIIKEMFS